MIHAHYSDLVSDTKAEKKIIFERFSSVVWFLSCSWLENVAKTWQPWLMISSFVEQRH